MANALALVADRLRNLVFGVDDARVRTTWRILLAWPLLWIPSGGVLAGTLQSSIEPIPAGPATSSGLGQSLVQGGFFLVGVVVWARYLDREPLSKYGVSSSSGWMRDFLAVLIGLAVWAVFSSMLGGKTIQAAPSTPDETVLVWLVFPSVALVLHAAVQQLVFFRVNLKNAAEGLHSRGVSAGRAVLPAVPVAVLFFVLLHDVSSPLRIFDLAVLAVSTGCSTYTPVPWPSASARMSGRSTPAPSSTRYCG